MEPAHIRAWQRLSDQVTTSGSLRENELQDLLEIGVTRVIDLSTPGHPQTLQDEGRKLEALGIAYHNIPVPFDQPPGVHYSHFVSALETSDEVTHVHCVANWRVSAFFYRYNLEHGMAETEARTIMRVQWQPDASNRTLAAPWKDFVQEAKAAALARELAAQPQQPGDTEEE